MRPQPLIAALVASLPSSALASNTEHDRTPVIWDGGGGVCGLPVLQTPCMTVHDRSDNPLHIPYSIPFEDTDLAMDEVANSRRHQFFAFCNPVDRSTPLPTWITSADVADAEAVGQVRPGSVPAADILELRDDWDGCWYRINEDADRRPITCDMAMAGVDWDVSAVPAGVYTIDGYTYEPQINLWVLRPGVVKLHDGDPDAVGPAAAITTKEMSVYRNQVAMIEGCIDAVEGSTLSAYWAAAEDLGAGEDWVLYQSDLPTVGDALGFEFAPPPDSVGKIIGLRVVVTDPMDRSYTTYMAGRMTIINADGEGGCGGEGSFINGSSCDESGSSGTAESGGSGSSSGTTSVATGETGDTSRGQSEGPSGGCGCASNPTPSDSVTPLAVIMALCIRRSRRRLRGHAMLLGIPLVGCAASSSSANEESSSSGGGGPFREAIAYPEAWVLDMSVDPYPAHRDPAATCDAGWYEEFGVFEIDTTLCRYGSFSQPAAVDVPKGTTLEVVFTHDDLLSETPAVAHLAISIPERVLWEAEIEIPKPYGLVNADGIELPELAMGTPIGLHIHNHGYNAYRLVSLIATRAADP